MVLGVSLNIQNAFNSLPWSVIGRALARHRLPINLRRVLWSYLEEHRLQYKTADGTKVERRVERGVSQCSILGPLLWDLGFNGVLTDADLPPGCIVVCYADDTIVLAAGEDWEEARLKVNEALHSVTDVVESLGLKIAPGKTEAVGFNKGGRRAGKMTVRVLGTDVRLSSNLKYLGLLLDRRLTYEDHFAGLAAKTARATAALSRLLPNVGGPGRAARGLYANVIASIALYGFPVWADEAGGRRKIMSALRGAQRGIAGRAIRAYKTVSHATATALAGTPPLELTARVHAETYQVISEIKREQGLQAITPGLVTQIREAGRKKLFANWKRWITTARGGGGTTIKAIQSRLQDWSEARVDLTFRTTQVLTGHGCYHFGQYLRRIGKETSEICWFCDAVSNTADHTLQRYTAWANQRALLIEKIGHDISIPGIIGALLTEEGRRAVVSFAEAVMREKEEMERAREGIPASSSASQRRTHNKTLSMRQKTKTDD